MRAIGSTCYAGLGQIDGGPMDLFVQKEQDGVPYCVYSDKLLADSLQSARAAGASVADLSEDEREQLSSARGVVLPAGTVKAVVRGGRPFDSFLDEVKAAGKGLILLTTSWSTHYVPTDDLNMIRQIKTCQGMSWGGAVVMLEPAGGFRDPPYLLYGGIVAGVILAGYLILR